MNTRRLILIAILAFACAFALRWITREQGVSRPIRPSLTSKTAMISAPERALRPNYPYSVIPGGAYSPAELRYANDTDSLVRAHYADFNLRDARLVTLTEERLQYVSYRLHNQVFWTRNRLRIPKGEVLLTDGVHYARTRCGNRLSSTPQSNTSEMQPPLWLLSLPPFQPELLQKGEVTLAPAPPIGELAQEFPVLPFQMPTLTPYVPPTSPTAPPIVAAWPPIGIPLPIIPVVGGYLPPRPPSSPKPVPPSPLAPTAPPPVIAEVPEPASLYLFAFTLLVSLWFLTRMMRQNAKSQQSANQDSAVVGSTNNSTLTE